MSDSAERRLRDALSAAADTVTEDDLRPLTPPPPRRMASRARWLMPVAAAVMVGVVACVSVLVGQTRKANPDKPAASAKIPPFFLVVRNDSDEWKRKLEIRDSATGQLRDAKSWKNSSPISGDQVFRYVTASRVPLTYFVTTEASGDCGLFTYRLKLKPNGKVQQFKRVGRAINGGGDIKPGSTAISPDGEKMAYAVTECRTNNYQLVVEDLSSGKQQHWPPSSHFITSLSWARDGNRLAFLSRTANSEDDLYPSGDGEVRMIDTRAPVGKLETTARLLVREGKQLPNIWTAVITPDARRVILAVQSTKNWYNEDSEVSRGSMSIFEHATSSGRLKRLYRTPKKAIRYEPIVKTDPSGKHLLVSADKFGRLSGSLTPLKLGYATNMVRDIAW